MAEEIGALRAALSASSAAFEKDMKAARDAVRRSANDMQSAMNGVAESFNRTLKNAFSLRNIIPQLFAGASVAGLVYFVKSTIDAADRLNDLSKSTGVSVETLSTMGYAAKQSGVDMESLGIGFKKLGKNMADAASGTGEAKDAFKVLGISVKDNNGNLKTSEQVMLELADKFAGIEDGAGKTALAIKIFGKSGADLIPLLNEGGNGLARLQREAREAGVALSTEAAQAADQFNDNLGRLAANLKGTVLPLITDFVAGINSVFEAYKKTDWDRLDMAEEKLKKLKALQEAMASGSRIKIFETARPAVSAAPELGSYWDFVAKGDGALKRLSASIQATEKNITELHDLLTHRPETKKKSAPPVIDDETKKLTEAIDKQIEALTMQANTFGMTEEAAAFYKFTLQQGVTPAQIEAARELLTIIAAQKAQTKEFEKSIEAEKKLAETGKRVFEETRTPMEELNAKVRELNELLNAGAIDFETYSRAIQQAEGQFGDKLKKTNSEAKDQFEELKRTIEGWGRDSAAAFVDFAKTGKTSFSDLIDSIITDMLRMAVYESFFKPLFGFISGKLPAGGTPTPAPTPSAHGNAFSNGRIVPFAKGGVISRPMTFPLGLAGEAGPEAILPLKRIGGDLGVKADLSGAGGGQTVVNHNYISAVDSKSFFDMCRRNPDAITSVFSRDMRMAGPTRSAIRRNL